MSIFNKFSNIFEKLGGGSESVLGIDISSSSIKVVQGKKVAGAGKLETYGELALGPYTGIETGRATNLSVEKIAEALRDLMTEAKVTTKDAGIAIPVSSSLINVIKMPNVSESKLSNMVPIEMRKYIPVPVSEVVMDWRVVPRSNEEGDDDKLDVFVVAIHKDTISRYQNIVKEAGLDISFLEIESFSTIRSVVDDSRNPSMIIDFGAATTKIYIVDRGVIRDSHIINKGSQDINMALSRSTGVSLEKAEEIKREEGISKENKGNNYKVSTLVVESVLKEANRVMVRFEKKFNKIVDKAYLAGGGSILKGFKEYANEVVDAEVLIGDPFSNLNYPAFLEGTLKKAGPEFAVAVGVLLRKLEDVE